MTTAVSSILFDETTIQKRVAELADEIKTRSRQQEQTDAPLIFLIVLSGAFIFAADLLRHIEDPVELAFVRCSSYGDQTKSSGNVIITFDERTVWKNKDVIIIEDIVDSGRTLTALKERLLHKEGARSVTLMAFLNKPSRREVGIEPDLVGFEIPDHFVVGYGLDYAGRYRNLPYLAVLFPEAISD